MQTSDEREHLLSGDMECSDIDVCKQSKPSFEISSSIMQETYLLLKISLQICLALLIELIPDTLGLIYIGSLPNADILLSSLGLSRTLYMIVFIILWGVISSLFTLIPQAIGAEKNNLIAIYLQRCFYLTFIASIPLIIILCYGGTILSYMTRTKNVINYDTVNGECRYFIITIYCYICLCILHRIPSSMNLNFEIMICCMIATLFSYPSCYLFISYLNMKTFGYPLQTAMCRTINIFLTILIYYKYDLLFVFKPISLYNIFSINRIIEYIYLAIPSTIICLFEILISDFAIVYCAWITSPNISISASVVMLSISTYITFIAMGLSNGLSIRIGKYIGANMIEKAKQCIKLCRIISFIISVLTFIVLINARTALPNFFTKNQDIVALASNLLYVLMITQFFFVAVFSRYGIFKGIGKPKYPAIIVICSYFLLPFPFMFILLFVFNLNNSLLYGTICIFGTIGIGNFISFIIMEFYLLFKLNWISITNESEIRLFETQN